MLVVIKDDICDLAVNLVNILLARYFFEIVLWMFKNIPENKSFIQCTQVQAGTSK